MLAQGSEVLGDEELGAEGVADSEAAQGVAGGSTVVEGVGSGVGRRVVGCGRVGS